jgi:hypothetical protein
VAKKQDKPEQEDQPVAITNRLRYVRNPTRAADLFERILKSVEKAGAREQREKQGAENK